MTATANFAATQRRQLALAAGLLVLGALLMLLAGGRPWAHAVVSPPPPLPQQRIAVSGADLGPVVRALALLALAGVAALVAVRGWPRRLVGGLLVGTGVAAVLTLRLAGAPHVRDAGAVQTHVTAGASVTVGGRTGWPAAYTLGGVAVAVAGTLAVARGGSWPALGARYDAPAARRRSEPAADPVRDAWAALDRGEDPTLR